MPMLSLEKAVRSLPMPVRFAGFESNTLKLAQAGWDLSMRQTMDVRYSEPELQLALRYESKGSGVAMFALSSPISMRYGEMRQVQMLGRDSTDMYGKEMELTKVLAAMGFEIIYIAPSVRFAVIPQRHVGVGRFSDAFEPIDPMPQVVEERMEDFKFFKVAKPRVQDLIVDPSMVPELLEKVLQAQAPLVKEIKKREQSRANEKWMRDGFEIKESREVAAQLITMVR